MSGAAAYAAVMWALLLMLAASLGSFATVLVARLPRSILGTVPAGVRYNIATPASHCPQCHTPLRFWHNIPLLSFLYLRGRCAYCGEKIAARYFWIELGVVVIALACVLLWGWQWQALAAFVFAYVLWVLMWIDVQHQLLPDGLTLSLLMMGLLVRVYAAGSMALMDAILGALLGYALLCVPAWLYRRWRAVDGLGAGDCKLMAAIGVWLGVVAVPYVLLLSSALGLVFGLWLWCGQRRAGQNSVHLGQLKMPFGPFLALAAVMVGIYQYGTYF